MKSPVDALPEKVASETDELLGTERVLTALIGTVISANLHWLARPLVRLARWQFRDQPIGHRKEHDTQPRPTGLFAVNPGHECALLLFVPRSLKSHFIDDLTGAYGYSHVAVDAGELDALTRKPIMTESTLSDVVHRSFQDEYGDRPYVRVPLGSLRVDCSALRKCVEDKLGEPYSDKEALTWGAIDDPVKEICSDLAANCLPEHVRTDIVRAHDRREVRPYAVSVHRTGRRQPKVFVSPNGFAEYFGAPPGRNIHEPNLVVQPNGPFSEESARSHPRLAPQEVFFVLVMTLFASLLIGVLVRRQHDLE